jgi:hypothetical protein
MVGLSHSSLPLQVLLQIESEERLDSHVHFSISKEGREGESEEVGEGEGEGEIYGDDYCGTEQSASELFMSSLLCKGRLTNNNSRGNG